MTISQLLLDQEGLNSLHSQFKHYAVTAAPQGTAERFPMELIDVDRAAFSQPGWSTLRRRSENCILLTAQDGRTLEVCWGTSIAARSPGDWYTMVQGPENFAAITLDENGHYLVYLTRKKSQLAKAIGSGSAPGSGPQHRIFGRDLESSSEKSSDVGRWPTTFTDQSQLLTALPRLLWDYYM